MGRPRTRGCGTDAGYRWHRRHAQYPCLPCILANAEANAERARRHRARRAELRARQAAERAPTEAEYRAMIRLRLRHPKKWEALLRQEQARDDEDAA